MERISFYKVSNIEIENAKIEIGKNAFIEATPQFVNFPSIEQIFRYGANINHLNIPFDSLIASPVALYTLATSKEHEENPFGVPECAFIALALSIVCDNFFLSGIGCHCLPNENRENWYIMQDVCVVQGKKGEKNILTNESIYKLQLAYEFVRKNLRYNNSSDEINLVIQYVRTVRKPLIASIHILGSGFSDFVDGDQKTIVNSALFLEAVFPALLNRRAEKEKSINMWNRNMVDAYMDMADIKVIMNYRHMFVHSNASTAKKDIAEWQKKTAIQNSRLLIKRSILQLLMLKKS